MMKHKDLFPSDRALNPIIEFFLTVSIFDRINREELKIIAKQMNKIQLMGGEILFKESDPGNYIGFIESGTLHVVKHSESGMHTVLETLTRGQSIGEISVIDDLPRSATIQAGEPSTIYALSKSAFDFILERHPKIGIKLLKGISCLMCYNIRKTSNRLVDYLLPME